jgi:photosystem II stability/assembly factor-like uncharacterized protein
MNHRLPPDRGLGAGCAALALACALSACEHAPDLSAARAHAAAPLQRYDTIQSLSAAGGVVLAGTQSGAILRSADRGAHWQRLPLAGASVIAIDHCPDGSFIALDFYHRVWSAGADGSAWTAHALADPANALALHCAPDNRWWVAGSRATFAVSADQGAHWTSSRLKEDTQITTLQFLDAQQAYALGEFGTVLRSTDGGASWQRLPKIAGDFYPYDARFISVQEGYASGLAGVMLATHDGGQHWQREDNSSGAALYRLFAHGDEVWAVGANGVVARHAAHAWLALPQDAGTPAPIFSATSDGDAVLIGGPGGLLRQARAAAQ